MAKVVDELLVKLGVDPAKWKAGLAEASTASNSFIGGLKNHQKELAGLTLTSGLTLASQIAFIKDVTSEYAKEEGAIVKLQSNLKDDQRTRQDSIGTLTAQAQALEKITPFANEQIISMQGTAAAFKLTDEQIEKLTPALLDTASGFRDVEGNALDLESVTKAVGKAIDGQSLGLRKMGIDVKLTGDKTKDFEIVLDALKSRFDGAAEAAGTTFAGKMAIASHQIDEVKKHIGEALAPTIVDLTNKILPLVERFGAWAQSHKDIVLAIVGGGLAGGGLLAALSAAGLAISVFGSAAGPVGLAIVGIAALVGWIIKLKVESDKLTTMPTSLEGVDAAIKETTALVDKLAKSLDEMTDAGEGPDSKRIASGDAELQAAEKHLEELQKLREKLAAQVVPAEIVGPTLPTSQPDEHAAALATARAAEFDNKATQEWLNAKLALIDKEHQDELQKAEAAGKDTVAIDIKYKKAQLDAEQQYYAASRELHARQLAQQQADRKSGADTFVGPRTPEDELTDQVNANAGIKIVPDADTVAHDWDNIVQIHDDALGSMEDRTQQYAASVIEELDREREANAQAGAAILGSWGSTFLSLLDANDAFGQAMVKATFLTVLRIGHAKIQEALGELLIVKAKEVGKALMGAPLSFGASLAAIPAILAGFAAATAAVGAAEKAFAPKGFEQGGIVPSTGHYLVHAGEVVINPRKNTIADVAKNLASAGVNVATGGQGAAGNIGGTSQQFHFTNYGPLRSDLDMKKALQAMAEFIMPMIPQTD
jgi:hypothetical protein